LIQSEDKEGGKVCVGKHSLPPSLSSDQINGVWGLVPSLVQGQSPWPSFLNRNRRAR